jgi:hypothetical protein
MIVTYDNLNRLAGESALRAVKKFIRIFEYYSLTI